MMTNMKHYGSSRNRKRPDGNFVTYNSMSNLLGMDGKTITQIARYK